jgi:hypothetical protein
MMYYHDMGVCLCGDAPGFSARSRPMRVLCVLWRRSLQLYVDTLCLERESLFLSLSLEREREKQGFSLYVETAQGGKCRRTQEKT